MIPATDEQIARVKDYMLHGCLNDEYSEALAAVLSELTELRRKVTDQENSLRHAAEEATAYKHDAKIDAERIDKMAAELATLRDYRERMETAHGERLYAIEKLLDHFDEAGELKGNGKWRWREIWQCCKDFDEGSSKAAKLFDSAALAKRQK